MNAIEEVRKHAMEKYAGDEAQVNEFMEGFYKEALQKKAVEFARPMSGPTDHLSKGVFEGLGKGLGGLAVGLGLHGFNMALSGSRNSALHTNFLAALQKAIATSTYLKGADKNKVVQYAETIFKFAPHVATDPNLLSSILSSAVQGEGVDPMTIKTLVDLESRYVENSGATSFSPKTYV